MRFDALAERLDVLCESEPVVVVGISGFAGAGKTHLASRVRDRYSIRKEQVVHLDNIYTELPRGDGLFDDYDWSLLRTIVETVRVGDDLEYQGVGWDGTIYPWRSKEPPPPVLIVEGIRLFRPELMDLFDLSVWIACPPELALQRAKARDIAQGHDDEYMKRWDTEWQPKNLEYVEFYKPEGLVDIVYQDYR